MVPLVLTMVPSNTRLPPLLASIRPRLVAVAAPVLIVRVWPVEETASTIPPASLVNAMAPLPMLPEPEMVLLTLVIELPVTDCSR